MVIRSNTTELILPGRLISWYFCVYRDIVLAINNTKFTHIIIMAITTEQLELILEKIAENAKKDREETEERNAKRDEATIARYEAAQAKSDAEKKELLDKLAELTAAANVMSYLLLLLLH